MNTPLRPTGPSHPRQRMPSRARAQTGVVLIISLIMLVVISLLAAMSVRNATSTEAVAGNARTTLLATQAAEMALRFCENSLVQQAKGVTLLSVPPAPTLTFATPARWKSLSTWDTTPSVASLVPLSLVNETGVTTAAYKRAPECMIEPLQNGSTVSFVITARGFGPEETGSSFSRPSGSEVWMQSTIELD